MFQTVGWLVLLLAVENPAVEPISWQAAIQQWISDQWSAPSAQDTSAESDAQTGATVIPPEPVTAEPGDAAAPDEPAVEDTALAAPAEQENEPLEAIEESRPDELDDLVEGRGYGRSVDAEELTESIGDLLSDDGEVDWTTQAN